MFAKCMPSLPSLDVLFQIYKQERRISMLESLASSKILEYKNTEEGSCGAKSDFELVWTVPKYNG